MVRGFSQKGTRIGAIRLNASSTPGSGGNTNEKKKKIKDKTRRE
jgi:hypothetical protein